MSEPSKSLTTTEIIAVALVIAIAAFFGYRYYESLMAERDRRMQIAIGGNLRQISAAGQQYILEYDVPSVSYHQLAGSYFSPMTPVVGESYTHIVVSENGGSIDATGRVGRVVFTY